MWCREDPLTVFATSIGLSPSVRNVVHILVWEPFLYVIVIGVSMLTAKFNAEMFVCISQISEWRSVLRLNRRLLSLGWLCPVYWLWRQWPHMLNRWWFPDTAPLAAEVEEIWSPSESSSNSFQLSVRR